MTSLAIAAPGKYLTIAVAGEAYGIPVLKVREIIRHQKITAIPQLPEYVKGVIDLRGRVVPVIDLRVKFGLEATVAERTCIVVVHVALGASSSVAMGIVVDAVEEVANVATDEIEPTPDFGVSVDSAYLLGIAKGRGKVKMLLDIDRVVATETLCSVRERAIAS